MQGKCESDIILEISSIHSPGPSVELPDIISEALVTIVAARSVGANVEVCISFIVLVGGRLWPILTCGSAESFYSCST